ncbi:MAG: hypothetical protein JXQ65_13870 [Candidatus Marinimicrobia bacterium]|nr:hypothetical protein [Candidatus Neomarinimicrobiota bacterium]
MTKKFMLPMLITFLLLQSALSESDLYHYHTSAQNEKLVRQITQSSKDIMSYTVLTKTDSGKEILAVEITGQNHNTKPAILLVGGLEGYELTSVEICMDILKHISTHYSHDPSLSGLLETCTIYIIPNANPDASAHFFDSPRSQRKTNNLPVDHDLDGKTDEDGFNDLTGDGMIAMMRIKDLLGAWTIHQNYPVMVPCTAEDSLTERYTMHFEGFDDDGDGWLNEDVAGGVDLDKNFPYHFEFSDKEAGTYAVSQKESKALADFIFSHPEILLVYSFSDDNNLLTPWPASQNAGPEYMDEVQKKGVITKMLMEDALVMEQLTKKYRKIFQNMDYFQTEKNNGNFAEWVYYQTGRLSVTTPAWRFSLDPADSARCKNKDIEYYKWLQRSGHSGKVLAWQKIEHPDFPDQVVEIGGFLPNFRQNAPEDSLKPIFERNRLLVRSLCELLPKIEIADIRTKKLHDNIHHVDILITNKGALATSTEIGRHLRWVPKIRIQMDSKVEIFSGKNFALLDKIEGNGETRKVSWLIKTNKKSITLKVHSPVFGDITKEVTL